MPRPFKNRKDLGLDRMFETRSDAWEAVGLALETSHKSIRRAQRQALALIPLFIGVLVVFNERHKILGQHHPPFTDKNGKLIRDSSGQIEYHLSKWTHSAWSTPLQIAAVLAFMAIGWALARSIGKAAGPTLLKRMDPGTAGTVGFLIRLATVFLTVLVALHIAGVNTQGIAIGASFTAVIFGLAAQQTLGNLIAGMVLLSARPFRVGERVRLQAGAVGGSAEGIVSSLGLLYTTLARGDDRILIPNNVVLGAAVVPLREPESVDVKVRLLRTMRPGHLQDLLDQRITTPTRNGKASVVLEELDGEDIVVRVRATPERSDDGARLADEIIAVLSSVTSEHQPTQQLAVPDGEADGGGQASGQGNGDGDGDGNGNGSGNGHSGEAEAAGPSSRSDAARRAWWRPGD